MAPLPELIVVSQRPLIPKSGASFLLCNGNSVNRPHYLNILHAEVKIITTTPIGPSKLVTIGCYGLGHMGDNELFELLHMEKQLVFQSNAPGLFHIL